LDSGTIGLVAALFFVASGAQNHRGAAWKSMSSVQNIYIITTPLG
jgi:hypothetical protein